MTSHFKENTDGDVEEEKLKEEKEAVDQQQEGAETKEKEYDPDWYWWIQEGMRPTVEGETQEERQTRMGVEWVYEDDEEEEKEERKEEEEEGLAGEK